MNQWAFGLSGRKTFSVLVSVEEVGEVAEVSEEVVVGVVVGVTMMNLARSTVELVKSP